MRSPLLLPTRCAICRSIGPSPCGSCIGQLRAARPIPSFPGAQHLRCAALLEYDELGKCLLGSLKFRNDRSSLRWCALAIAEVITVVIADRPTVLTWVPTTPSRVARRGFDLPELVARALGRVLSVPVRSLLLRVAGGSQENRFGMSLNSSPSPTQYLVRYHAASYLKGKVLGQELLITCGASP